MVGGRLGDDAKPADVVESADLKADLREAYERGRRDERARRKRHHVGMTLTFAFALFGLVLVALAAVNGSFSAAGETGDQSLAISRPAASQAAATAGQQLRDATQSARQKTSNVAG